MKNHRILLSLCVIIVAIATSCSHRATATTDDADTIALGYASNLSLVRGDGYTIASLRDPWHAERVLHRYVLIAREDSARLAGESFPGMTRVVVPLRRSVVFNTAHVQLVSWLGAISQVRGVADLKYMNVAEVKEGVARGRIADCGNSMSPDIETMVAIGADGVLLSPFENSGGYGRLEQIGVPIIECADYMETSPLGRAEWMRFYGLLYGKEREADSLFREVERSYNELRQTERLRQEEKLRQKEKLQQKERLRHGHNKQGRREGNKGGAALTEKMTGNVWYVAGGKSTVSQMITDAGGSYAWAADEHSGSRAMAFEEVLSEAGDADVWWFIDSSPQPMSYERLAAEYRGYDQLRPFRLRRVWSVNPMQVPYFEEVSFRPDRLLRDYIIMLHPDSGLGETRYYKKLRQ